METLTVSLDATQLQRNTLYEAQIVLANNDAVSRIVKIPVYLNNDRESKVELQTLASTVVYTYGGYLVVQTDKASIEYIFGEYERRCNENAKCRWLYDEYEP